MTYYMYAKLYFEYVRTCKKNSTHFCATGQAATVFFSLVSRTTALVIIQGACSKHTVDGFALLF